jgi:hypothetical protein
MSTVITSFCAALGLTVPEGIDTRPEAAERHALRLQALAVRVAITGLGDSIAATKLARMPPITIALHRDIIIEAAGGWCGPPALWRMIDALKADTASVAGHVAKLVDHVAGGRIDADATLLQIAKEDRQQSALGDVFYYNAATGRALKSMTPRCTAEVACKLSGPEDVAQWVCLHGDILYFLDGKAIDADHEAVKRIRSSS